MANIKITIERLQPGIYVRLPLKWNQHPFLMNRFKIKDQNQLAVIRKLGLSYVYFDPQLSDVNPLPPFSKKEEAPEGNAGEIDTEVDELWKQKKERIEQYSAYKRKLNQCEKHFERSARRLRSAFSKVKIYPQDSLYEINEMVDEIVEQFLHDSPVSLQLVNGGAEFEDVQLHSLNVAIISMMIAKNRGYDDAFIKDIAFGALVHDIGKIKIPRQILKKGVPLTSAEEHYLHQHVKYGVEMVSRMEGFPETAAKIVGQHHETIDGSGYPNGLKKVDIDPASSIVAVANAFDCLCHPMVSSERRVPHAALSYMYKHEKEKYDLDNLAVLIKLMGVYPPGTIVELSNNMIGMVVSASGERSLTPEVLVYDETVPRSQATVIDISQKGLSILGVISPNKLSDEAKDYLNPSSRVSYFFTSDE